MLDLRLSPCIFFVLVVFFMYWYILQQSPCLIYAYFFFRHIFGGLFGLFSCISIYYNFQFGGNGYHRKKIGRWSSHRLSCRFQDSYIDVHLLIIKSTCRNHLTCKQISLFDARINSHIAI